MPGSAKAACTPARRSRSLGDRYADFVNGYEIDGYALAGLRAGWAGTRWSVYADVMNLLDEQYIVNHSVRNAAAPAMSNEPGCAVVRVRGCALATSVTCTSTPGLVQRRPGKRGT